jgi:AraC-like DNA-binding protein
VCVEAGYLYGRRRIDRNPDIVAGVRRELAERYLADPQRNLAEISSLLGFSSISGFSRWHRQQFGRTASAQRTASRRAPKNRSARRRDQA